MALSPGSALYIVPGVFALLSYRAWQRGEKERPTFAWARGWVGVVMAILPLMFIAGIFMIGPNELP